VADLHLRPRSVAEVHFSWFRIKTRQLVFDRSQRLDHLPGEEQFGPLLRLGNRQHSLLPMPVWTQTAGWFRRFPCAVVKRTFVGQT
jgi:hypothetical protein